MAEFGFIWIPTERGFPPGLGGPTEEHPMPNHGGVTPFSP